VTMREESVTKGVGQAFDHWLWNHEITTRDAVAEAVGDAFTTWLGTHTDQIIGAIAKEIVTANKHRLAGLFDEVPPPRPEGRTVNCPHCGELCADPASPDFISIQGCDEMAAEPDMADQANPRRPSPDWIAGYRQGFRDGNSDF
jgi:hypothetical protein